MKTLLEAVRYFSDPQVCVDTVASMRWEAGAPICPKCGGTEHYYLAKQFRWKCRDGKCGKQFSVKVGTIFEDSPLSLDKWLVAIWMIGNCKNGISSYEVARDLGITQKSAWFMLHRIRIAMTDETGLIGNNGTPVEIDETFVGGKAKNMHKSLVRSLFCGLPKQVDRMAVFVSASDESAGSNQLDQFVFAGWIASEPDWSEIIAPAWQRLVLDGPPAIPYLHMTDMRSQKWREEHGLSKEESNHRIDESIAIIDACDYMHPIGVTISGADVRQHFSKSRIRSSKGGSSKFDPDYLCFLAYALMALAYVDQNHPECRKLDFVVERKSQMTKYIQEFHDGLAIIFSAIGRPELGKLLGELIPSGKERIPVQAADVLCWHTARALRPDSMDADDVRRYRAISRKKGFREHISSEMVSVLASSILSGN